MLLELRVEPFSEGEDRLNELFKLTNTTKEVSVKLGIIFEHVSYNEYVFSEDVFNKIKKYLEENGVE